MFIVESAEVVQDWAVPDGQGDERSAHVLRLTGDWARAASRVREHQVVYATPRRRGR